MDARPPAVLTTLDRFRGCLLGSAVADALGAPFEGLDAYGIYTAFGFARRIIDHPPVDVLTYTDDTQMMIGVAETLARDGRIVEETLMRAFAANFDRGRGTGRTRAKWWRRRATGVTGAR